MLLRKVISGGQTGADQAGVEAARRAGIPTGGWMPKGFITQDGKRPEFAQLYGMREHSSSLYPPRTALNAKESDGTMRFAKNWNSRGELLTAEMCTRYNKKTFDVHLNITAAEEACDFIIANKIAVLNIAGNSEKTAPGIGRYVIAFLAKVFAMLPEREAILAQKTEQ